MKRNVNMAPVVWAGDPTRRCISTYCTPEMHQKFKDRATEQGLSVAALTHQLIKDFIENRPFTHWQDPRR